MTNFLNTDAIKISEEFKKQGYVIRDVSNFSSLDLIRNNLVEIISKKLENKSKGKAEDLLNLFHKKIQPSKLNSIRVKIINEINNINTFRKTYFSIFCPYLEQLVGNELVMQLRVNLSIQLPNDGSSLLPIHSDVWSGDSPFEVVAWLPLVDCYKTKSMYLLPPKHYHDFEKIFSKKNTINSEALYQKIKDKVKWLKIKYGQILIFNQTLPHGNIVNKENETRWTMNCRFKGAFTPYGDKKVGEFFEPITLRVASEIGMKYKLPKI